MERCKCAEWCRIENNLLTEHHPNCEHYHPEKECREMIVDLLDGIMAWASDEDGIHPECFEAFKKAAYFVQQPWRVTDDPA